MSAPYIIPFDNNPSVTGAGTGGVTVGAGKYARVTVTLSATAYASGVSAGAFGNAPAGGPSVCNSTTVTIWLKAGDVLSFSNTNASATVTATTSFYSYVTGTSTAAALVNGAEFASIDATVVGTTSNINTSTVNIAGTAKNRYFYEEFNVIS